MNIIEMTQVIDFIPNKMFPIPSLPDRPFAFSLMRFIANAVCAPSP